MSSITCQQSSTLFFSTSFPSISLVLADLPTYHSAQRLTHPSTGCRWYHLAWCQGFQKQPVRRAAARCHHSYQDARPGTGRQLWRVGWPVQYIRLRRQGDKEKGGCVCVASRQLWLMNANKMIGTTRLYVLDPDPVRSSLTRSRLPVSSQAVPSRFVAVKRRRGTVPLAVPSSLPSSRASVSVSRRCSQELPSWR